MLKKKYSIFEPTSKVSKNSILEYGKKCQKIKNIPVVANIWTNCHTKKTSNSGDYRRTRESKSLKRKLVLEKFKTEIDLLQMQGKYNEDKFQSIDHERYLHFQKTFQPDILEKIMKL